MHLSNKESSELHLSFSTFDREISTEQMGLYHKNSKKVSAMDKWHLLVDLHARHLEKWDRSELESTHLA